jgi:mRNA-degrading endonuclease RelE of RelBE toxin-antitoxin system
MKATHPSEEKFLRKFRKLPEDRKSEVLDFIDFLSRRKGGPVDHGDVYGANLEALRMKIREKGGLITGKNKEQVIKKLRATRETIWKEDYADHFGQ